MRRWKLGSRHVLTSIAVIAALATSVLGQVSSDSPDLVMYGRIRDEGISRSHVMEYDRLVAEDLRQAAVVIATFLYNTAMRDQLLPRTALPQ
jgi:hypothetical protein